MALDLAMQPPFDFPHLDPSRDPPELYVATFELLCGMWGKLRAFRLGCETDELLLALFRQLENQIVAAGLLLSIEAERRSRE
jgi:hypothetical protein